jgi:hypothetical protein
MDYYEVERLLTLLMNEADALLSASDRVELKLFFDAGEYGLTLETLETIFVGNEIAKTPLADKLIDELKSIMEM